MTPWTIQCMEFSRPEYWSGQPFPSAGGLLNPEIEPRSLTLQLDSLPHEPQGKPKNTRVGSLSLLQQIFPTPESNWGLLHCRQILYQLSGLYLSASISLSLHLSIVEIYHEELAHVIMEAGAPQMCCLLVRGPGKPVM